MIIPLLPHRFLSAVFLSFLLFVGGLILSIHDAEAEELVAFDEMSLTQKEALLDKTLEALIWFRSLGDEVNQRKVKPQEYRDKISPIEVIQAAALLHSFREEEQTALAEQILLFLPLYQLSLEEKFELNDIFGEEAITHLAEIRTEFIENLLLDAQQFRKEMLNSAEKVILYQEPQTALELMQAVDSLSVVGHPVLVRHYLRKFLNDKQYRVSPEAAATIVDSLGTQKLMQLAVHPEFESLSKRAVAKIIDEAKKHWNDEEKIAEALKETDWFTDHVQNNTAPQIRPEAQASLQVLWKGNTLSLQQAIQKLEELEETGNDEQADELAAILLSLRRDMKEAFAVIMQSDHDTLRHVAARGLAASVSPQESFLLYSFLFEDAGNESERESVKNILKRRGMTLPNQEQAAAFLFERGNAYFERRMSIHTDPDGRIASWSVSENDDKQEISPLYFEPESAYLHFAERYFEQSAKVVPQTSNHYDLYRLSHAMLLFERYRNANTDDPYPAIPYTFGGSLGDPGGIEQLLQMSLEKNCFRAVEAAVYYLGKQGNVELLKATGSKPRLLVQTLLAPNRRARFAALNAIMSLHPQESFAGSSLVADALVWFSKSEGEKIALSGHPQKGVASQTAGMLLGRGYKTDVAVTSRELFDRAAASPDVEFIFVDERTPLPPVGEFVQAMRQDARTAEIPIAVLSHQESDWNPRNNLMKRTEMSSIDQRHPESPFRNSLSLTYPLVSDEQSAQWIHDDLLEKADVHIVQPEKRIEQALQALDWLRNVKEQELQDSAIKIYHFDDFDSVVLDAMYGVNRSEKGLELAAVTRSSAIQAAVYEIAANMVYPMELRERAGKAFEQSMQRFGLLLRGNQIQRLYDRYNRSESEPKESQQLLSRLIDVIEAEHRKSLRENE